MRNKGLGAASFLVYGICVGTASLIPFSFLDQPQDQVISIILGGMWILLLFFLYRSLLRFGKEGEDFIDLIKNSFGKFTYVFILGVYWLFIIIMTGKDLAIVWGTISGLTLVKHAPMFIAALLVFHIFLICVQGGIKSIIQISVFFSTICFITNVVILLLSIGNIQSNYFLPLFYNGLHPAFREFYTISSNSSGEIFLFLFIPELCEEIRFHIKRILLPILFILGTFLIKYIVTVGLLGDYLKYVSIPGAIAAGALTIGSAQIRIEPLVILAWFVTAIIKLSVEYYVLAKLSSRLVKNDNVNVYLFPVGLIVWSITLIAFRDQLEIIKFPKSYAIYGTLFQLIIPLTLLLGLKLRKLNHRPKTAQQE
ncbi:GerAB/ArcD/ProY family transporter [Paenibacillus sp. Root444D2]|uniref:GerAB/ArcD/ProY family transporter n=1 Tax=Paenibacillus sp. Root444D2 TaxID=1736538 RepID=UPI00070B3FBE|nr:GerAB/ArcD/ProY family transporter [Paenibacillus sp. Root444D2]KQX44652.1 hypothetical protein ASD40_21900 [Paenibacillus sp. Root444D2]